MQVDGNLKPQKDTKPISHLSAQKKHNSTTKVFRVSFRKHVTYKKAKHFVHQRNHSSKKI